MPKELKVGDIVEIIDDELLGYGKKVEIIEIKEDGNPDGPIGVRFGSELGLIYGHNFKDNTIRYQKNQLRFISESWDSEVKAIRLFGENGWHTLYSLKDPLDKNQKCMYKNCSKLRQKRILINCWGSVSEFDACEKHADSLNGSRMDCLPTI